jgi:bacterioferritin (cytochrome b1)
MNLPEFPWFSLPRVAANPHTDQEIIGENQEAIGRLNSLLRDEIAAAETYRMVIDKLIHDGQDPSRVVAIRDVQRQHIRAEQIFRKRVAELGGVPDDSSGSWGAWSSVVVSTAQLFSDGAALRALRHGEEEVLHEMRSAIDGVDSETATLIEKVMIPAQNRHIQWLGKLIAEISA